MQETFHVVSTLYWVDGDITQVVITHDAHGNRINYPISKLEAMRIATELNTLSSEKPIIGYGQAMPPTYSVMIDVDSQII